MKTVFTKLIFPGILSVAIAVLFMITCTLNAQQTVEMDREMMLAQNLLAPVKVDGDVLFLVRGTTTFPAADRAEAISKRIRKAASDYSLSVDSIKIRSVADHLEIYDGSEFIMNVYPGDAEIEHLSMETFTNLIKKESELQLKYTG